MYVRLLRTHSNFSKRKVCYHMISFSFSQSFDTISSISVWKKARQINELEKFLVGSGTFTRIFFQKKSEGRERGWQRESERITAAWMLLLCVVLYFISSMIAFGVSPCTLNLIAILLITKIKSSTFTMNVIVLFNCMKQKFFLSVNHGHDNVISTHD